MNKFQLNECTMLLVALALVAGFVDLNVYVGASSLNQPVTSIIVEKDHVLFENNHVLASGSSPPPLMVDLTLIDNAASQGAVCLDGTSPGYHLDRGTGSGENSWLIQLEGGGWCNTIRNCVFRKTTRRGSSKFMEKKLPFTGILSNRPEDNPDFFNWNRVKLRYCDGASFTGDSQDEAAQLNFRGQKIWSVAMDLLMYEGMQAAKQALLSGCSAGGLASILHCDDFRDLFPTTTKVKCLSDAGMFLDAIDVSGGRTLRNFYAGVVSVQGLQKTLPRTCINHLDPTSCFFPENLITNIKTPMFLLNSAYDAWQVQASLAPASADPHGLWSACKSNHANCNSSQLQFLQDFRNQMLNAVKDFSMSRENGLFINSCFAHCQTERQDTWFADDSPLLDNRPIALSVGDWYFDRRMVKAIDCAYPCDRTCHDLNFKEDISSTTLAYSQSAKLSITLLNLLCALLMPITCLRWLRLFHSYVAFCFLITVCFLFTFPR